MKIKVPVIAETDVLIIGGTTDAVDTALKLKKNGFSVFIATQFSYFGEDLCATLDLQSPKTSSYVSLFKTESVLRPSDIKRKLDKLIIDAGIEFLFHIRPVRPMFDCDGNICGALFADRSGFHAVSAKVIVDATLRGTFARMSGVPYEEFCPGRKKATMFAIGGASTSSGNVSVKRLPSDVIEKNRKYAVYEISAQLELSSPDPFCEARAIAGLRKAVWSPDCVASSSIVQIERGDNLQSNWAPTRKIPVFIKADCSEISHFTSSASRTQPVGFGEKKVDYGTGIDIVKKDVSFRFNDCRTVDFELNCFDEIGSCDVFVAGGGTGGMPAAIGASESGASVILAENQCSPGGVMLVGRIGKYCWGNIVGFTRRVDTGWRAMSEQNNIPLDSPDMNIPWKSEWFIEQADKAGCSMLFDTMTIAAVMCGHEARGAVVAGSFGVGVIKSSFVIDATGNADFAASAGAETFCEMHDEAVVQGAGLSPVELGSNYSNTDFTFVLDTDVVDTTRAFVSAHDKFTEFFDVTTILNTRERRQIIGDIFLQPWDFFAGRTYSDTIVRARSNFDTHGFVVNPIFMIKPPAHEGYYADVPLRALLPRGYNGIAATGLGVSAHRDCMPLIRMQPDVQNQGYAAGIAAALSVKSGKSIRDIDVKELQRRLVKEGILEEAVITQTDVQFNRNEDDDYNTISYAFSVPDKGIPEMESRLMSNPEDLEAALTLTFLKSEKGVSALLKLLEKGEWDEGWNYRGMHQFGFSASRVDTAILALAPLHKGIEYVDTLTRKLSPESEFSHIRAVALFYMKNPDHAMSEIFESILAQKGMQGYAIRTYAQSIASNNSDWNDNSYRNSQLKELYLAKALFACDPASETARSIINSYACGMQGVYAMFAHD